MNAPHALDLSLRRESQIEPVRLEIPNTLRPRRQALFPALDASLRGLRILFGEIGADSHHRLEHDAVRHEVRRIPPSVAPHALRRLEKIAHDRIELFRRPLIRAARLDAT